jgi:hypothetical protein
VLASNRHGGFFGNLYHADTSYFPIQRFQNGMSLELTKIGGDNESIKANKTFSP